MKAPSLLFLLFLLSNYTHAQYHSGYCFADKDPYVHEALRSTQRFAEKGTVLKEQ